MRRGSEAIEEINLFIYLLADLLLRDAGYQTWNCEHVFQFSFIDLMT